MTVRVLVVEDDESIGDTVDSALRVAGLDSTWVRSVESARALDGADLDLVLLDIGLPDGNGFDLCRELRLHHPRATIVMLTARRDPIDVVAGLESGADDYLFKPFSLVELLARVRAHLRRSGGEDTNGVLRVGSLTVDRGARSAWLGSRELVLRHREFDLLARLAASAGQAVSRETLMAEVWDENWFGSTKTLDVHLVAVRRKLIEASAAVSLDSAAAAPVIRTLRGHGYRLDAELPRP